MPFGHKARAVRAYEYGCLCPIEGEEVALAQMRGRVRLWNALVELDQGYAPRREAILSPYVPTALPVGEAEDWTTEEKAQYDAWKQERKAAYKREDVVASLRSLDKEEYEAARVLWLGSGLYWVNWGDVVDSWLKARKPRKGKKSFLRFHAWARTDGKVSVRPEHRTGQPIAHAFEGQSTEFRLQPMPEAAYTSPVRGERRRLARSVVYLRVGSEERKPVWLVLPVVLHRPLPPDGLIRSASVLREKIGTHYRWKLVLIVETPESTPVPQGSGTLGLDIGWRRRSEGMRVAYWHDEAGQHAELCLSEEWLNGMRKVEDLRSIRDQHFNTTKSALVAWLKEPHTRPVWLEERTSHLAQWRSTARLASVVLAWRESRFDGDGAIYDTLEAWRKKDKHLLEFEANLRDRLLRDRRERYRLFAAWAARTYGRVRLEEFNLSKVARVKGVDAEDHLPKEARHQRFWACCSELRHALENACGREGVLVEKVQAAYTTQTCQDCGYVHAFDAAAELEPTCPACGVRIDQDRRAAQNLLVGGVA